MSSKLTLGLVFFDILFLLQQTKGDRNLQQDGTRTSLQRSYKNSMLFTSSKLDIQILALLSASYVRIQCIPGFQMDMPDCIFHDNEIIINIKYYD